MGYKTAKKSKSKSKKGKSKSIKLNYAKNLSKKHKKYKKLNCSPKKEHNFTCYSSNSLEKLKNNWNKYHTNARILTNNSKVIWNKLYDKIKSCNTEKCWLEKDFIKNNLDSELKNNTFAPDSPKKWESNPTEWLNSNDLTNVMKQYEHKYPSFVFIGPSPIDYDNKKFFGQCVWNKLCNFNLKDYIKKGKSKIGVIFNTDPHYLDGAHWICMFIDVDKNYIYYFDSTAERTPKQINKFANKVIKQGNSLGIKFKYIKNKTEHQKEDTECGIYVLFVITQLLKNKMKPVDFNIRIPDKEMEKLRKILFN